MKSTVELLKSTYESLPKIPQMRKLWHAGYWDGPLSGLCLVEGEKCWFECIDEYLNNNSSPYDDEDESEEAINWNPPWYRRFLIVKLTHDQLVPIERRHAKWQRMVGTHCDYDENGKRGRYRDTDTITNETVAQFYKESQQEQVEELVPATPKHILGWWEWT